MARSVLALAFLALALTGCGDRSERAYYRSRSVPTDIEGSYTSVQRAAWKGDPSVYELPSRPPSLDGESPERVNCVKPGPQFKPQVIVGLHPDTRGGAGNDLQPMGGWDGRPVPVGALDPMPGSPISGQRNVEPSSLYTTTIPMQVAGDWDSRPRNASGEGTATIPATPAGIQRDMAKDDYCLPSETPLAATPASRSR